MHASYNSEQFQFRDCHCMHTHMCIRDLERNVACTCIEHREHVYAYLSCGAPGTVAFRLPGCATSALRIGAINADCTLAVMADAASSTDLWPGMKPVCRTTQQFARDAVSCWSPARHSMYHESFRAAILTIMQVRTSPLPCSVNPLGHGFTFVRTIATAPCALAVAPGSWARKWSASVCARCAIRSSLAEPRPGM